MRDYGVVAAPAVRRFLVELDWEERERLVTRIMAELRSDDPRRLDDSGNFLREICGYWVTYRPLQENERELEGLRDGDLVLDLDYLSRRLP